VPAPSGRTHHLPECQTNKLPSLEKQERKQRKLDQVGMIGKDMHGSVPTKRSVLGLPSVPARIDNSRVFDAAFRDRYQSSNLRSVPVSPTDSAHLPSNSTMLPAVDALLMNRRFGVDQSAIGSCKLSLPLGMEGWESGVPTLCKIAKQWEIPGEVLTACSNMFTEFVPCSSSTRKNILRDGRMDLSSFYKLLCKMSSSASVEELPPALVQDSFKLIDRNNSGCIDFVEFAEWYQGMAFHSSMFVDKNEMYTRHVARKLKINNADMDRFTALYSKFDLDASGTISRDEFRKLMHVLMKTTPGLDIPESRIEHFFMEADENGSGCIDLEEFVKFYLQYFNVGASDPMEDFYSHYLPSPLKGQPIQHGW